MPGLSLAVAGAAAVLLPDEAVPPPPPVAKQPLRAIAAAKRVVVLRTRVMLMGFLLGALGLAGRPPAPQRARLSPKRCYRLPTFRGPRVHPHAPTVFQASPPLTEMTWPVM